jgi:hypothetical protein
VTGFLATVASRKNSTRLDASIGASGPHDFAVRLGAVRQWHISVHRISPHVRDDREPPLIRVRRAESITDLPDGDSEIFFWMGLDRANHVEAAQQIGVFARPDCWRFDGRTAGLRVLWDRRQVMKIAELN